MGYSEEDRQWILKMKSNLNNCLKSCPKIYKNWNNRCYKKEEMYKKTEIKVSSTNFFKIK